MSHNLIQNPARYRRCFCNTNGGNDIVELLKFPTGQMSTIHIARQEIAFIIRGAGQAAIEGFTVARKLKKDDFVFMPAGSRLTYNMSPDSAVLVVRIPGESPECPASGLGNAVGNVAPQNDPTGIHVLRVNRRVGNFVTELIETLADGLVCRQYMQNEATRLLFLLNAYYSEDDRLKFFSHILTPDIKFSEFVRMNHMKLGSTGELSKALRMTSQAFSNRFKKVFGTTPHKWMLQEKARHIYNDICHTDLSLKEIALKYDFKLSSNFFRFCKQTFGDSPGRIRKNLNRNQGLGPDGGDGANNGPRRR